MVIWADVNVHRRRRWHPTPVLLPGKSHGWRSLLGCSPWGRQESNTTERLDFHFSLSCIGEGNGNPLQWSCLENPRDGGAWWAAIYGVAQSQTRLKQLSSSSNNIHKNNDLKNWTGWISILKVSIPKFQVYYATGINEEIESSLIIAMAWNTLWC